jgi:hypothetical protein
MVIIKEQNMRKFFFFKKKIIKEYFVRSNECRSSILASDIFFFIFHFVCFVLLFKL